VPKVTLKKRERSFLMIAVLVAVVLALTKIAGGPWKTYQLSIAAEKQAQARLIEVRGWRDEVEAHRASQEAVKKLVDRREDGFGGLWTFVNTALREAGLQGRAELKSMNPRNYSLTRDLTMAELELSGVNLTEVVDLLHRLYAGNNLIAVHELSYLRPARNPKDGLNCKIVAVAPK
jgi:hypothetical protein